MSPHTTMVPGVTSNMPLLFPSSPAFNRYGRTVCIFCDIIAGRTEAQIVYSDDSVLAFLDIRPVFPGHTLVVPREHHVTLADLPTDAVAPFFSAVKMLSVAVAEAMDADGSFLGINNNVSQSVPHLHMHVVPRRFKDGLRGFFWPRRKYKSADEMAAIAASIRATIGPER